nr:hypothetical protein CFP56_14286 [Quercus suber]
MVHDSDDKVYNEVDDHGLYRSNVVPIGQDQSKCVLVDGMDMSAHLGAKPSSHNVDFQEILKEIDMGLSKFTSDPPLRTLIGLALPFDDSRSLEVQKSSVTEGRTLLGGQI